MEKRELKKVLLLALKIAVGSSAAIYIAQWLQLDYATSAGTITLLTLMTTKWETVKLSLFRLLTFFVTVMLASIIFLYIPTSWFDFGLLIFLMVFLSESFGLRSTISVNAVIGAHFLVSRDFSFRAVRNELILVVIGVVIAVLLNLFHDNYNSRKYIAEKIRHVETKLQMIIGALAAYLENKEMQIDVWRDIHMLKGELEDLIREAHEYRENTFQSHHGYYIAYFEMRQNQLHVLNNLHYEMNKIRTVPKQSKVIAEYMLYLTDYVVERNEPQEQIRRLQDIFMEMKEEALPGSREEFENRAILYHILMDIEDFLNYKSAFVKGLDERQRKEYWS